MLQKKLELALKILIGLTFFMPLAFFPSSFIFPFIVPKIIIFRTLALLMLGVYIILLAMNLDKFKIKLTLLNIVVVLFVLSFTVSTFLGIDWYRSFWDNHERMLGLFTVIHYVLYYFIITSVIREWNDWRWFLRAFLFAGGIVMTVAFIQQFDQEFLMNTSGNRSAATLGNAIYVGGYGIFLAFVGLLLALKEKNTFWKWFAGIAGFLGFLGIFFSGTRGAFLGVVAGIMALFIFYFITLRDNKKIRIILVSIVLGGAAIFGILYLFRSNKVVANLPLVNRFFSIQLSGFTSTTRGMAWGIAIDGWRDKPIMGWGPGNYYYAFNKYYRPEFLRFGYRETWFDNAHNIVLNTLTERGATGLIIYLSLFAVAIYMLLRAYKENSLNLHVAGISMAFLFAHLVQTLTVFENPTSYLYFFFFLAFVNAQVIKSSGEEHKEVLSPKTDTPFGVIAIVSVAILLLIYTTNINPARANMATLNVIRGMYNLQDITFLYKELLDIPTPHIDDVRNDFARTVSTGLRNYVQAGKPELAQALFQLAYGELSKNLELHPLDVRVHAQQSLLVQDAAAMSGNKYLLLDAEEIMEDALAKSPRRQQFIYTLAGIKIQLQKLDEAETLYKQAIADDRMIGESWWRLALLYSIAGKPKEAMAFIEEAQKIGVQFDAEGNAMVADITVKSKVEGAEGAYTQ